MSWHANQIYAKSNPEVIAAFRKQPFLADQLYHVDDLRGVRSENTTNESKHIMLPTQGLLVVSPDIYQTGYDRKGPDAGDFSRHYCHNTPWPNSPPGAKWSAVGVPSDSDVFFPDGFDRDYYSLNLLRFLKTVYKQTLQPLVYYHCVMWGGDIEKETAWIIDTDERVYQYADNRSVIEHTVEGSQVIKGSLLPYAMRHVGVNLPTPFFALHEASFHWQRYRMENAE
jgi:hypothetical protein